MAQEAQFPFQLNNAFLTSLRFSRLPEMPETQEFNLGVEVNVAEIDFPGRLQIALKVETIGESPLTFRIELIGLFDYVEGEPEPDRSIVWDFVNQKALYILWPYVTQIVRQLTAQMGIGPVNLRIPYKFDFAPPQKPTEASGPSS
jgi:preprotein translocase subunit SecB